MKSMPIAALEDFFASPEFEEAFNRWRAKYTAAAMVDLSPTALEPFPAPVPPLSVNDLADCWVCGGWTMKDGSNPSEEYAAIVAFPLCRCNPDDVRDPTGFWTGKYQQSNTPPTYIKDSPLMEIIEQSDSEPADEYARRVRG